MPQLHRVLQGVWRLSRDRWRSVRKGRCIEWKAAIGCRKELTQTALESLSANAFLKCHDDWANLMEDDVFSKILEAEKDATTSFFAQAKGSDRSESIANLQAEAVNMLPTEEVIPEAQDDFMYFQRPTVDGYIQFGRYPINHPEAEEVILDTSTLAEGTGLADVIACKVSDDHKLLAYVVDLTGDDSFELHVRPVASSNAETVRIPGIRSVEFLGRVGNSIDLLAVRIDATTKRAKQVLHLRLTGSRITEHLMWEEQNPAAYLELFRTKNRKFVLASSNTKDTSAVRFVKCDAHMDLTKLLEPIPGVEYFAEHREGDFFVISNHERSDFSVYLLPESKAGSNWSQLKHFFTPPGEMHVTDADLLSSWLILYGHEAAAPRICVVPIAEPQSAYLVDLPRIGSVEPGVNADHDADQIRFTFRSPVEPGCIYNLDLSNRILSLEGKRTGGFTSLIQSVECDRFDCAARDGERIPVTLLRPSRELQPGPCLLHVYGAYGTCMTPDFRPEHLMLLRRGWLLAWAHVRGGGERGWAWHQAGRQLQKSRSVLDLADVARFLLSRDMVAPGALCLKASSAGAITLGSFLNCGENAALVGAAILEVPFLDVLNSMSDPMLPLTAHEFAEWGDPRDPEHEFNIRSLCPYENIGSHSYPHIYLSCALADARAPAWMTVKYAARMRARTPGYMSNTGHGLS